MVDQQPGDLYRWTMAYRAGDEAAGWKAAMSRQMTAIIGRQATILGRYDYINHMAVEDIKIDLMMRVLERLKEFTPPDHGDDVKNEKAMVAYFKLKILHLSQQAVKLLVGPDACKTGGDIDVHVAMSQIAPVSTDPRETPLTMDQFAGHMLNPDEALDRNERAMVMSMCRRFFASDTEAVQGFTALQMSSMGCEDWSEIAEAIGLNSKHRKRAQYLSARYRNIMRASILEAGHWCDFTILSIYTDDHVGAVTVMHGNGKTDTRVTNVKTVHAPDAFSRRIRSILKQEDITFAVLNRSDTNSMLRSATLMALHLRSPLITLVDSLSIERALVGQPSGAMKRKLSLMNPPRRRCTLMARALHAKYTILSGSQ